MANKSNTTPIRAKKDATKPRVAKKSSTPQAKKPQTPKPPKDHKPKENGRPPIYTPELAIRVCEQIATSNMSLRTICKMEGMPSVATILKWLRDDEGGFAGQYARAKEEQADLLVEDMLDISEHTNEDHTAFTGANVVQRDKLRIETRKWIASKLKPKKYGDKLDVITTNTNISVGYEAVNED